MNLPEEITHNRQRTIARSLTFSLVVTIILAFFTFGLVSNAIVSQRMAQAQVDQSALIVDNLANILGGPLAANDPAAIAQNVQAYQEATNVAGIRVTDASGTIVYEVDSLGTAAKPYTVSRLVTSDGQFVGQVEMTFTGQLVQQLRRNIMIILMILLVPTTLVIAIAARLFITRFVSKPLDELASGLEQIASSNYHYRLPAMREADVNFIAQVANNLTDQIEERDQELRNLIEMLEKRVAERTRDLALAAEVGRYVSQIHDLDDLLRESVELIRTWFELYHVQIYLVDEAQQTLRLVASTGLIGKQLLAEQHKLSTSATSINSRAVSQKRAILVADTAVSDAFQPHPLLPETRSETAVPLITGNRVVGVLDLQSSQPGALSTETIPAFEALAGQLAVSIDNAALFRQQTQLAQELQENTTFLDNVIDNLPVMLFVKDATDLRFIRWNKAGSELTGIPAEAFIGKTDFDFFPPEEAAFFAQKDRQVIQDGVLVDIPEEPIETTDKGTRLLHTVKVPLMDLSGKPKYLMGVSEDITERKEAEYFLNERVKELNLLNDIGRKAVQQPTVADYLQYVAQHIPTGMQFVELCRAAITLDDVIYGEPEAINLACQIVEGLIIEGKQAGRIYIAYTEQRAFLNEESALIGEIGRRVSSYIEGRRLLERNQTTAANLQIVSEISTVVASSPSKQQLLQDAVNLTQTGFNLYHVQVYLYDDNYDELILSAGSGEIGRQIVAENLRVPLSSSSFVARAGRTRQTIVVNDTRSDPGFLAHHLLPATQSELVSPLIVGDVLLGVLDIHSEVKDRFMEETVNVQTTLAAQFAVALQNAARFEQNQIALQELNALQRLMVREGWGAFARRKEDVVRGYVANREMVQPIAGQTGEETQAEETAVTIPMQIQGAIIGKLGVRRPDGQPLSTSDQLFLEAISLQVAQALEKSRLFEETEQARSQTEALFAGSDRVVRATTMADILYALVDVTELKQLDTASLILFNEPWQTKPPSVITVMALWQKEGQLPDIGLGIPFPAELYPMLQYLTRERPFVSHDISQDPHLDEATKRAFGDLSYMKTAIAVPLVTGDLWIGFVVGLAAQVHYLSDAAVRQLTSLAGQAATVAQTLRLFAEAQVQVQNEQTLRQVSDRVYAAADAESMLRTAAEEIGRALGMETFVILEQDGLQTETAVPQPISVNGAN